MTKYQVLLKHGYVLFGLIKNTNTPIGIKLVDDELLYFNYITRNQLKGINVTLDNFQDLVDIKYLVTEDKMFNINNKYVNTIYKELSKDFSNSKKLDKADLKDKRIVLLDNAFNKSIFRNVEDILKLKFNYYTYAIERSGMNYILYVDLSKSLKLLLDLDIVLTLNNIDVDVADPLSYVKKENDIVIQIGNRDDIECDVADYVITHYEFQQALHTIFNSKLADELFNSKHKIMYKDDAVLCSIFNLHRLLLNYKHSVQLYNTKFVYNMYNIIFNTDTDYLNPHTKALNYLKNNLNLIADRINVQMIINKLLDKKVRNNITDYSNLVFTLVNLTIVLEHYINIAILENNTVLALSFDFETVNNKNEPKVPWIIVKRILYKIRDVLIKYNLFKDVILCERSEYVIIKNTTPIVKINNNIDIVSKQVKSLSYYSSLIDKLPSTFYKHNVNNLNIRNLEE